MRGSTGRIERVLKVIPYDRWVSAKEIAAETEIGSHKVAGIIRRHLLIAYVESRSSRSYERGRKLYRRLRLIDKERKQ